MIKEMAIREMKRVFSEIPYGVEHTLRVLKNAEKIMEGEDIDEDKKELIELTAILHDIGAVEALNKYGSLEGHYQEIEGPSVATDILRRLGYPESSIERVCFIIGNHHTPSKIDDIDFQIQWEADLIENLLGSDIKGNKLKLDEVIEKNFKTDGGRRLVKEVFNI